MTTARPLGREDVMRAVIDGATKLFLEKGPSATSIRDIAAVSQVNHGLVYRHFGAKDRLVAAVLDDLSDQFNALVRQGAPANEVDAAADRHMRALARSILDGYPVGQLQHGFPFVQAMVDEARAHEHRRDQEDQVRLRAAQAVALELGWRLFEPFLRTAAGIDHLTDDQARQPTHLLSRCILRGGGLAPQEQPRLVGRAGGTTRKSATAKGPRARRLK